jgi:hypothetical protein
MSLINSSIKKIRKDYLIWAPADSAQGQTIRVTPDNAATQIAQIQKQSPGAEIYYRPKLTHVGESHITISMGPLLQQALDDYAQQKGIEGEGLEKNIRVLRDVKIGGRPLFERSSGSYFKGLTSDVSFPRTSPFEVFRAGFYKDEADPSGPMLVALSVTAALYSQVRVALGMPPTFVLPNGKAWAQHITLGYIPRKNMIGKSYVDRFGKNPRQKKRKNETP